MTRGLLCLLLAFSLAQCATFGRRVSIIYASIASELMPGEVLIELSRSFVETYKNRVTIKASFTVDETMASPNPRLFDGDLHFAGRAPEIGLRLVGEIINAATADTAVALVRAAKSSQRPLQLTGVWRLWPEHAVGPKHEQGRPAAPLTNANPDHAFEIHPVTKLGNLDLLPTFQTVEGYKPGSPKTFTEVYEKAECNLKVGPATVTLSVTTGLYNDVHFVMRIADDRQLVVGDGRFVLASALDEEGNVLVERLRTVFVKGSSPERAIRSLKRGARLHVWGLPRVDFSEISRRVTAAASDSAALKGKLPYEIIVLGVYPDE